jgi:hypothetical protein
VLLLPVEDDGDLALVVHDFPGRNLLLETQRGEGLANYLGYCRHHCNIVQYVQYVQYSRHCP